MKYLLIAIMLIVTVTASAELQIGLGTQLVQEIGTDIYFPLVGQVKVIVPVTSVLSIEARAIGETFAEGNSGHTYRYSGLGGIGFEMDGMTMTFGGGVHYFDEEYVPRAYYSMSFDLNYLQRVEILTTFDLNGDPRPVGCGFIFSIGI